MPPTTEKPAPETVAWEILTVAVPEFLTVTLCDVVLPTATLPKLGLLGVADRVPEPVGGGSPPVTAGLILV